MVHRRDQTGRGPVEWKGSIQHAVGTRTICKIRSMRNTVFDKSARETQDSDVAGEGDKRRAFLTPFPNTTGVTAVMPEKNSDDHVFSQTDDHFHNAVRVASNPTTTGDTA